MVNLSSPTATLVPLVLRAFAASTVRFRQSYYSPQSMNT
jgi:hypothetical protein